MLRLRYRGTGTVPVEAECVRPDRLLDFTAAEVAALLVQYGNAPAPLGDFFHVEGDGADGEVVVEGDCRSVKLLGAGMTAGRLTIHGDAGMHTGAEMAGGEVHVHGSVGDWAGAEMRGGRLHVRGGAGDLLGAAYRGGRSGMRGGVILVEGTAGDEVGATLRRGLIAVGGAGDFAGVSMIAGSLFVFGPAGLRAGAGMRRGSIVFFGPAPELLPTFRPTCTCEPVWLEVYLRRLRAWGYPAAEGGRWLRYAGDLLCGGKGEVLVRA